MMGCLKLGLLEEKRGNLSQATDLYQKACEGGEMMSCTQTLGLLNIREVIYLRPQIFFRKPARGDI